MMGGSWDSSASRSLAYAGKEIPRNAMCPCGSKKKYKRYPLEFSVLTD